MTFGRLDAYNDQKNNENYENIQFTMDIPMKVHGKKLKCNHDAICMMNPGLNFCMCSESKIHKDIQVSLFAHNGTWFHISTNIRGILVTGRGERPLAEVGWHPEPVDIPLQSTSSRCTYRIGGEKA